MSRSKSSTNTAVVAPATAPVSATVAPTEKKGRGGAKKSTETKEQVVAAPAVAPVQDVAVVSVPAEKKGRGGAKKSVVDAPVVQEQVVQMPVVEADKDVAIDEDEVEKCKKLMHKTRVSMTLAAAEYKKACDE